MNVSSIKHLGNYSLRLFFDDETIGDVDLSEQIESGRHPFIRQLRDPILFREAYVEDGTVRWPNGADFAVEYLYALAHRLRVPETIEDAEENQMIMSLRELRSYADVRQEDLAALLSVTQGAVSRLEAHGAEARLSTLRRYAKALGWKVEVIAVKGNKRILLRGV